METTFHNVLITISAESPKEAYTRLCKLLGSEKGVEYTTDTYTVDTDDGTGDHFETAELMPCTHERQYVNDRCLFMCSDCGEELGR